MAKNRKGGRTSSDSDTKSLSEMSSTELGKLLHRLDRKYDYPPSKKKNKYTRAEVEKEYFRRTAAESREVNRPGVNPERARVAWHRAEDKVLEEDFGDTDNIRTPMPSITDTKRRDMLYMANRPLAKNRGGSVKGRPAKRSAENS